MHGMALNGSGSPQVIFRLVVPNANCGSLIGKAGNNIRELRGVSVFSSSHFDTYVIYLSYVLVSDKSYGLISHGSTGQRIKRAEMFALITQLSR